jgi:MSHA biogenesis protein MshL
MKSHTRSRMLLALLVLGAVAARADEPRIDVAVQNAPARAFFEGLVDGTAYNVVLDPAVAGQVSVRLHNVTVPEALEAVKEAYGFDYHRFGSSYVVLPATVQTRLFQVDYLDVERRGSSRTRVTSGQVSQANRSPGVSTAGGYPGAAAPAPVATGVDGTAGASGERGSELTGSSIATRSASEFWKDLEANLKSLVGNEPGRNVVINPSSGVIAVRGTPRELRDVQEYLGRIQDVVTREVVLEAKILEVTLSDGFQAGINWALLGRNGAHTLLGGQTGPQQGFGQNLFQQPSQTVNLQPGTSNPITSLATNTLGGAFSLAINATDFNAFIEAMSTQGKTRVLSSPRVSTLNNQKAVIKAGSDEFFVTNVYSNAVASTVTTSSNNVELTPFFSGVALDVTPQVSAEGQVILHIHPTVSDVTSKILSFSFGGETDSLPLAFSQIRESDSVVKAKSGQIIVIGGLMRTETDYTDYRTPLLGDIPVLGNLFKSQQRMNSKSELVILLRPVVVKQDGDWESQVAAPVARATAIDPKSGAGLP